VSSRITLVDANEVGCDQAWFRGNAYGSGVARAIVERIECSSGGGQYWRLDYLEMVREFEFTEKQLRAAVDRLVKYGFARIDKDPLGGGWFELVMLTPSRLAREEEERAKAAKRVAQRAARLNPPGRPRISEDVRAAVYVRDGGRCQVCGSNENLTMDHKHPWSKGGPDTIENLRVLCRSCNSRKGDRV
jgi:hypothetical protein